MAWISKSMENDGRIPFLCTEQTMMNDGKFWMTVSSSNNIDHQLRQIDRYSAEKYNKSFLGEPAKPH